MIGFKRHLPKYGDMYADWNPANRNEAQQLNFGQHYVLPVHYRIYNNVPVFGSPGWNHC